jgi:hypothetical protein
MRVTAEPNETGEPSSGSDRRPWKAPLVARFGAAGANGGEANFNSADGESA